MVEFKPGFLRKKHAFCGVGKSNLASVWGVVWGMGLTKCDKRVMIIMCGKRVKTRAIGVS